LYSLAYQRSAQRTTAMKSHVIGLLARTLSVRLWKLWNGSSKISALICPWSGPLAAVMEVFSPSNLLKMREQASTLRVLPHKLVSPCTSSTLDQLLQLICMVFGARTTNTSKSWMEKTLSSQEEVSQTGGDCTSRPLTQSQTSGQRS